MSLVIEANTENEDIDPFFELKVGKKSMPCIDRYAFRRAWLSKALGAGKYALLLIEL